MPQYRIGMTGPPLFKALCSMTHAYIGAEISPNNRAGCKDTVCKEEKVKILKGEIRFGSWVEINEHGSWAWKHW